MMIKSLRQLGTRAALTGACLASFACLLMPSAQAQGMGYSKPHVDLAANNMQPAYPPSAQINGENGSVIVSVLVSTSGKVQQTKLYQSSGFDDLDNAAIAGVMSWKFVPAMRDGSPESDWAKVKIDFQIPGGVPTPTPTH
jgi:TonB family protein